MATKYNWIEVQKFYDEGHTVLETCDKFGMSMQTTVKSKYFKTRPESERKAMAVSTRRKKGNLGHSQETKNKLSNIAIARGFGGKNYRKTFYYNGVVLESSYELAVAKELDSNKIRWSRPKRFMWIDSNEKVHHYTPDFYLIDYDVYLDPKNDYLITIDSEKIKLCSEQNNIVVIILNRNMLVWEEINKLVSTQD